MEKLLSANEQFQKQMLIPAMKQFYDTRPIVVQNYIRKFPWEFYKIKSGAPYGISCGGSYVELLSYRESGEFSVALRYQHLTEKGKEHLKALCNQFNKSYDEAIKNNHQIVVDSRYLEPITNEEYSKALTN